MATEGRYFETTGIAGADYSGATAQYHAIVLATGVVAANAETATGILLNKPASGRAATIGYFGEMKYAAAAAISAGAKLTVTTSGWFTTAGSFDAVVGEAKTTVTSGSFGTGLFNFPTVTDKAENALAFTAATTVGVAGVAIALDDNSVANNGGEADGVAVAAVTSGTIGKIIVQGLVDIRVATAYSAGDYLRVTTSGYFTAAASGYYTVAKLLANTASGGVGLGVFGLPNYENDSGYIL